MIWVSLAAALALSGVALEVWWTRRRNRRVTTETTEYVGQHRPETLVVVDDLHRISYPHLFRRYQRYVSLYGRGEVQAQYWCWRLRRMAELRQSAADRKALADYRWMVLYEQTAELAAVAS